ncbi:UNVERIFIED_CONTAM: hypothetical protein GTU68_016041 [Idotea baltica]|nr:hypothetical protein [Idotea baltica]
MASTKALFTKDLKFAHDEHLSWQFEDIELDQGDHLLVLGGSGSGKTTLLHLLSGLLKPQAGEIVLDGVNIGAMKKKDVDEVRGLKIGMVFQRPHFIKSLNVRENIALAAQLPHKIVSKNNIEQTMQQLNIFHLSDKQINTLSEGEKQRASIARALANDPILILADEPTSALDDENCSAVIKLLIDVSKKSNCALIVVTHDARIKSHFPNQIHISSK